MAELLVVDTSVLIDVRRNVSHAVEYVAELAARRLAAIHPVSVGEMLDGVLNRRHLDETMEFLTAFRRLKVKTVDFDRCIGIQVETRLPFGVGWPDCLIAATCIRLALPLVTLNDKHFRPIRGMKVIRPY